MNKPLIGVTCNELQRVPETITEGIGIPGQDWQLIATDYTRMIEQAGGIPVLLPICKNPLQTKPLWEKLDGILLSGGHDVDPSLYGERINAKCGHLDTDRDCYEIMFAHFALDHHLPILGICRGIQILNVTLGGTIYQDLPSNGYELHTILSKKRNEGTHKVRIIKNSLLDKILGCTEITVNSFHHQAVNKLAPSLKAIAISEDNVTEAVVLPGPVFVLATQWHPEMMFDNEQQQKIAAAFISACSEK